MFAGFYLLGNVEKAFIGRPPRRARPRCTGDAGIYDVLLVAPLKHRAACTRVNVVRTITQYNDAQLPYCISLYRNCLQKDIAVVEQQYPLIRTLKVRGLIGARCRWYIRDSSLLEYSYDSLSTRSLCMPIKEIASKQNNSSEKHGRDVEKSSRDSHASSISCRGACGAILLQICELRCWQAKCRVHAPVSLPCLQ